GDQMAVHVPLSNAAVLEAQVLMLSAHNILNPQSGNPMTVPSQDMVLGLYYITKSRKSTEELKVRGEGKTFYSSEEVIIAYNENKVDLHAPIKCRVNVLDENGELVWKIIETTVGRVIFNEVVPESVGFINALLTKKAIGKVIGEIIKSTDIPTTARFLDDIKDLGFRWAFKGGLSFNIGDLVEVEEKQELIDRSQAEVDEVIYSYMNGFITDKERYNNIIDIWSRLNTRLTGELLTKLTNDKQGFNSVFMMLDSGARGSKEQIRQLAAMRGLMAKPRKSGNTGGGEIIENPILSNLKGGLSVLEYF
ncbi:MAG TPA: DNA-directed RNA polymerase subunit beta', partial [Bacteroidetes bacterium]|nr:DNA-directed RNA polymerase subunit beta' [Bacteroidota bacterium]